MVRYRGCHQVHSAVVALIRLAFTHIHLPFAHTTPTPAQFGKVYRGLWRGTEVAIKSMVLPSKMSGAEKLERMAIMEAAISSSLSHPNVVQVRMRSVRVALWSAFCICKAVWLCLDGAQKLERMALMEAAISSSLSHFNVVEMREGKAFCVHRLLTSGIHPPRYCRSTVDQLCMQPMQP